MKKNVARIFILIIAFSLFFLFKTKDETQLKIVEIPNEKSHQVNNTPKKKIQKTSSVSKKKNNKHSIKKSFQKTISSNKRSINKLESFYETSLPEKYKKSVQYLKSSSILFKNKKMLVDIAQVQIRSPRGDVSNFRVALNQETGAILQTWGRDIKESPLLRRSASINDLKAVLKED